MIPAAGFVSFPTTQFNFILNGAGETIYFIQPNGSRVLDAVQFGAQANGVSNGRWPDGANDFYPLQPPTPGANNSAILISDIVINELMYDPISGNDDDQYIELYNKGTNTVNLTGWQLTAGVTFTFPEHLARSERLPGVARNLTNLFRKLSEFERREYGGQLQRQVLAQRRAHGLDHAANVERRTRQFWWPKIR